MIGAWDFQANITKNIASTYIIDTSPNVLNGHAINLPARGMTGYNWTADEIVYHHAPEEYGAIHFHDDDIDDARWDADFSFTAPEGLKSGFYAARLRIGGEESAATEDYIPFVVRPPKDQALGAGRGHHPDQQLPRVLQRQSRNQLGGGAAARGQGAADAGLRPLPQRAS